ncbi:MAG: VanZ family protein [Chloroflexi bacterium]|nr:VanZ family protein [Chloroflexota bacterium]
MIHIVRYWLPLVLWMAAIFYGSSRKSLPGPLSWSPIEGFIAGKAMHVLEYAGLFVLLHRALLARRPRGSPAASPAEREDIPPWRASTLIQALAISFLFALSDELHQSFVPRRDAQLLDVGWDMLGAASGLVAILLGKLLHRLTPGRLLPPAKPSSREGTVIHA